MTNTTFSNRTLNDLIDTSCQQHGSRPALGMAMATPLTYDEFRDRILRTAFVLADLGLQKGDRVAILAENSPEWCIAYLAIVRLGAVAVPILPDFPEADVRHILGDSGARILFTSERQMGENYEAIGPALETVITLDDGSTTDSQVAVRTFSSLLAEKEVLSSDDLKTLAATTATVTARDLAAIIYTSGTSGHSKAVMLTHQNLIANVASANGVIAIKPDWTFLSILPLSHAYEFTLGFLLSLDNGARIVYPGARPTPTVLGKICQAEQPTVLCLVPLVMEKIYKKKVQPLLTSHPIFRCAVRVPGLRRLILRKIGSKLLDFFGGRLELLAIGGAAINCEVERFLAEAGFPYIVGYGLTEAAPLLAGGPFLDRTVAVGSVGKPIANVEIRIANPLPDTGVGEIHARGPNIMLGYYKNPVLTRETINQEGWLATGDLGVLDNRNNLFIKGRSKSVIVLSHGENIYPEALEDKINSFPHVLESLAKENYGRLEAWVYLDYERIDQETKGQSQQHKRQYIDGLLKKMQQEVNSQLPVYSQITRFIEQQEPFIKTATHKIKRYLYTDSD